MRTSFYKSIYFYIAILALNACKSTQQVTPTNHTAELDITANQYTEVPTDNSIYEYLAAQEAEEPPAWISQKGDYNPEETKYFNLINTKLDVSFDWEKERMPGIATLTLSPLFYPQDNLVLDAKEFDIHQIAKVSFKDTIRLEYSYDSLELTIRLDRTYTSKDTLQIEVRYTAKPSELPKGGSQAITAERGLYFINADNSDPNKPQQIWTQGETEASSCWFPTFDAPNVKTRQEVYITVDTAFTTVSNGRLVSQYENPNGTRTDYWKMDQPHAPYLFAMAVGKFAKVSEEWNGKEVSYYVEPDYKPFAKQIFGNTPEMLAFFSEKLNYPYPWDKYSQVVVRDFVSGAMENTTVSIFMEDLQVDDRYLIDDHWDGIIAHELFHHWFGDLVTCESWANLPLNESFATYAEYLWSEYKYGKNVADLEWKDNLDSYLAESETKQEPLIRYNYLDKEEMFDNHSYAKGSLILHLLRNYVGDEAFFKALNTYLTTHAYETAEIHDLRQAFEKVTGQDWNWFFEQWFMQPGHPSLYVKDEYESDTLYVTVNQQQNENYTPIYRLPLAVEIWQGDKKTTKEIVVTQQSETFSFPMSTAPSLVLLDPKSLMPGIIDHIKTTEAFIQQYKDAESVLARIDALVQLSNGLEEAKILPVIIAALSDRDPVIRELAVETFENYEGPQKEMVVNTLKDLVENDENSIVRGTALNSIATLGEFPNIIKNALNDSSYVVNAFALYSLGKLEKENALNTIATFENVKNLNVSSTVADYFSYYSIEGKYDWFANKINTSQNDEKPIFINYLGSYLMSQPLDLQLKGVSTFEDLAKNHGTSRVRLAAFQSLALLSDIEGVSTLLKEIRDTEKDEMLKQYYDMLGN